MDADGLPLIGSSVDYQKVSPINQKKTVEYLNHFIVHTAGFLNRFSTVCENKLASLSTRIERLNTQMSLLEGKINSIPGLEHVVAPSTTTQPAQDVTSTTTTDTVTTSKPDVNTDRTQQPHTQVTESSAVSSTTVSQDPRYAKYFKMLSFGVPSHAVKQKVLLEGLNPDLLDTPSAPVVDGGTVAAQPAVSDEDFSDDEDYKEESSDDSVTFSD